LRAVGKGIEAVADSVKGLVSPVLDSISAKVESIMGSIKDELAKSGIDIKQYIARSSDHLHKYLTSGLEAVSSRLEEIPISMEHFISGILDSVIDLGKLFEKFKEDLFDKLDNLFTITPDKMEEYSREMFNLMRKQQEIWKKYMKHQR